LPIHRRRIMHFPENLQKLIVTDRRWFVLDLDYLSMAGIPGANLFIAWIRRTAARVTGSNRLDALEPLKERLHAPEAAAAKSGEFSFGCSSTGFLLSTHIDSKDNNKERHRNTADDQRFSISERV
jgi:hypothetical protein